MRSRRAVGSLIGIGFLLMILAMGFSFYEIVNRIERSSAGTLLEMAAIERDAADENLDIQRVRLTGGNSLNLTIKNTGNVLSELVWIGVFDDTSNTQDYYRVVESLNPTENQMNIGNATIVMNPLNEYTIQVLTKLGNIYYGEYPEPVVSGGGDSGGGEVQFFFVDNFVDTQAPTAFGTHSLFSAMQSGPDGINDVLIEGSDSGVDFNTTMINAESFEGTWPPVGWSSTDRWNRESNQEYDGTQSADFDGGIFGQTGNLLTPVMDFSDGAYIYIDFWYYDDDLEATEFELEYYDGTSWDLIADLGTNTEDVWLHYQETVSDPQYLISDFQIRWVITTATNGEHAYVDLVTVIKETASSLSYNLDLEVSWSGLPTKSNEWLTVYGGTIGAETLQVDYWNGVAWVNIIPSVSPGWNNVDVSGILSSSSFIIRFNDSLGIGDIVQSNFEIDAVYLNLWD